MKIIISIIWVHRVVFMFFALLIEAPSVHGCERFGIDDLERRISQIHDQTIKKMPEGVRREITESKDPESFGTYKADVQRWMHENVRPPLEHHKGIAEGIIDLQERITGEDFSEIAKLTFVRRLLGLPLELDEELRRVGIYWTENEKPTVIFAPQGQGVVHWFWKLKVAERPYGVLHVGLDQKTRRFLCYEHTVGVYYPEGEVLERIYTEIVQNLDLAGIHIGKGRIDRIKETDSLEER